MTNRRKTGTLRSIVSILLALILTISTCLPAQADVFGVLAFITKRVISAKGVEYEVKVSYDWKADIPRDAELEVRELDKDSPEYQKYLEASKSAVGGTVTSAGFMDISIMHDGQKIEPKSDVTVEIRELGAKPDGEANVIHFVDMEGDRAVDDGVSLIEEPMAVEDAVLKAGAEDTGLEDMALVEEALPAEEASPVEIMDSRKEEDTITFTTSSFSIYGIIYTVDFRWGVEGAEYSFPGGSTISLRELMKTLHILDRQSDTEELLVPDGSSIPTDVSNEEDMEEFLRNIQSVTFSDESLIKPVKITEGITAGALKDKWNLTPEYSAEYSADDGVVFYPPDWALVSLKPFTTDEYLTVTMQDGESLTIAVTDAQIQRDYISASGETYRITVTYDESADIPDGADLEVKEIPLATEEYFSYLDASKENLGLQDISFARFFDIEILKDGEKVEPKAPVQVEIVYKTPVSIGTDEYLSIVHFGDDGDEVISDVRTSGSKITYAQDSFSITGTVVSAGPRDGQSYMLIVEYEGKNYIINNDGTLIPVTDINANQISTDMPMLWTYYYQYGGNFRFASEASGFNSDQTASGFYYRYLDPNVASGLTEEDASHPHLESATRINYNGTSISSASNGNLYIGVSSEGGTLHVVGAQNSRNAAEITLYNPSAVNPALPANHTVNHIDISISGSAQVDVPFAYGVYYYKDDNGDWKKIIVGDKIEDPNDGIPLGHARYSNYTESLVAENVGITSDDMKRATIKTYKTKTENGVQVPDLENEVHDAFYITGYSANETTLWSTDQVRIEGSFRVSTMAPVDDNWWTVNSVDTRHARKAQAITYVVEAKKSLQLDLTYTDDQGVKRQLYQSTTDDEPMTVNAEIPMGASFNYWTDINGVGNECPPLQEAWGYRSEWKDGGIHSWGISGMDFVLTSHVTGVPANIVALEITKKIVKEVDKGDGTKEYVVIDNITAPIDSTFEVYQDKPGDPTTVREVGSEVHDYGTYRKLHDHKIPIGTNGIGHWYDYNVSNGMYYIRESRDGLPTQIQTSDGKTYAYIKTQIQTEYSYRANSYRTRDPETGRTTSQQMHDRTIASQTADLNSIPEVLGDYKDDNGADEKNEFLEFYFYNVYSETETPPPPEPVYKTLEINLDKKWQDGDDTTAPTDGSVAFKLHKVDVATNTEVTSDGYPKTFTVRAADNWKLSIPDLPWYESDTDHSYEKHYKYWLEEIVTDATGTDVQRYGVPSFTNGYGSVNQPIEGTEDDEQITVEVTNKTGNVIRIQKRWINIDPDTAPDVTIDIWKQKIDVPNNNESPTLYRTVTLTKANRVAGKNWWMTEIALPTDRPPYTELVWDPDVGANVNVTKYGDYAYYISERNPDGTNNGTSDSYLNPRFYKLIGDQVVDDYDAYDDVNPIGFGDNNWTTRRDQGWTKFGQSMHAYTKASEGQDSTLIVMNAPKDSFQQVVLFKTWYKLDANGSLVQASTNDVGKYAIGLQIYQRLKQTGSNWAPFANPFYIATSQDTIYCDGKTYINENNPFTFEYVQNDNGVWKWRFLQYDGIRNGFPRYGLVNGQKVEYEYEVREIGVFTGNHASTADELTRVFDYVNEKQWQFDEAHKDAQNNDNAKGINVEAGSLKVTKTWTGGHEGSRIYFELYCGNENITEKIIADPESYGLNEFNVFDDGSNKALIVSFDGQNWEELLIQGLPKAPASGSSPYQYSIKEIGYSEADGTNCWAGKTVIESDGSVRKDPYGDTVRIQITDLLTGYQIDTNASQAPVDGKSGLVDLTGNDIHTITANNRYEEKYTDFEFIKVWQNRAGDFATWPKDNAGKDVIINVELYVKDNDANPIATIPLFITPPDQYTERTFDWEINGRNVTFNVGVSVDASGTIYTFKIPNLPAKDGEENPYSYSVKEKALDGYETSYGNIIEVTQTVPETDSEGQPVYEEDGTTPKTKTVTSKQFEKEDGLEKITNGKTISNKNTAPITISVNKAWVDETGAAIQDTSNYSATFTLHRLKSYTEKVTETITSQAAILKIGYYGIYNGEYYYGDFGADETYYFTPGSEVTITYDYGDSTKRSYVIEENGNIVQLADQSGTFVINMPPAFDQTYHLCFYFEEGNWLDDWNVLGTRPEDITVEREIVHVDEVDDFTSTLTLSGGQTSGTFNSGLYSGTANAGKFPVQQTTIEGVTYTYKYYVTEDVVNGFTTTGGGTVSSESFTESFVNQKEQPPVVTPPDGHKVKTDNGDGTYKIHLNVSADSQTTEEVTKSNVIIILDESSSMYFGKYYSVGEAVDGVVPDFEEIEGVTYHYNTGDNPNRLTLRNGTFYYRNNPYSGPVYYFKTRLDHEREALSEMLDKLLSYNRPGQVTSDGIPLDDVVEIQLIGFNSGAWEQGSQGWSTDKTELMNALNGIQLSDETHWWDALNLARQKAIEKHAQETDQDIYVLLLTDGRPLIKTLWYPFTDTNEESCRTSVANLMNLGYIDFYSIYTYGNLRDMDYYLDNPALETGRNPEKEYLIKLTNYAYGRGYTLANTDILRQHYFDADNPADMVDALDSLFRTVTHSVAYGRVSLTDTLTSHEAATALVAGEPEGITYTVTGEKDYTVTASKDDQGIVVTFLINDQVYTTRDVKTGTDGKPYYEVTVGGVDYKMALASYNDTTHKLEWDLTGIGTLEQGCTYDVSFDIWPNQKAYDYVADLNNRKPGVTWDASTQTPVYKVEDNVSTLQYYKNGVAGHPDIVKYPGDGVDSTDRYAVLTNEDQTLTYSIVTGSNYDGPYTKRLETPDPMELKDKKVRVQKLWNDSMDPTQLEEIADNQFQVNLVLKQGNANYVSPITIKPYRRDGVLQRTWPEINESTNQPIDHDISVGLMVSEAEAKESGLYAAIIKQPEKYKKVVYQPQTGPAVTYYILDEGYDYKFEENPIDKHFELEERVFHPMLVDDQMKDVRFSGEGENRKIEYIENLTMENNTVNVTATNNLKGGIQITKKVYKEDGTTPITDDKTKFTIKVDLKKPDGSAYTVDDDKGGYRIIYGPNNPDKKEAGSEGTSDSYPYGRSERVGISGGSFTASIYVGDTIQVANVDKGVTYVITEESVPSGYNFIAVSYTNPPHSAGDPTPYSMTSNTSHQVVVKNAKNSTVEITILKEDAIKTSSYLEGAVFELWKLSGEQWKVVPSSEVQGLDSKSRFTVPVSGTTLKGLKDGSYRLKEISAPEGYVIKSQIPVSFTVTNGEITWTGDARYVKTSAGAQFTVPNQPGVELPATGGVGTDIFYGIGLLLTLLSAITLLMKQRVNN